MSEKKNFYLKIRDLMHKKNEELTRIQQSIVLVHAMNLNLGLQCINRQGQNIQFPQNWRTQVKEGVYKFNYKHKDKVIQYRYVNNDGTILYVNFVPEDSDELLKTQIIFEKQKVQEIMNFYQKQIKQKLLGEKKQQKKQTNNIQITRLQPVYRSPNQGQNPNIRPTIPLNIPTTNPYNSPFGNEEYVGPNSNIFQGGGNRQPNFNIGGMRRPPGSRFDPIDPFGNNNLDDDPDSRDFMGFNSDGKPFGGNRFGGNGFGGNGFGGNGFGGNNRGPFI